MGFLDFLFDKEKSAERNLQKHEKKITNMFVQAPERQYAIQELREMGTTDAVWVMLQRYNENNSNTTVDIEEKELVYASLVRMAKGSDADVIGQVKRYVLEKEVKINWPMKVLQELLPEQEYVDFMVEVLQTCDTAYQRTTEKKQELMLRAMDVKSEALAEQIGRFLSDSNETIRFLAVDAALAQDDAEPLCEPLFAQLLDEDSERIIKKVIPALVGRHNLRVPEALREPVAQMLPEGLGVHSDGYIYRHRR